MWCADLRPEGIHIGTLACHSHAPPPYPAPRVLGQHVEGSGVFSVVLHNASLYKTVRWAHQPTPAHAASAPHARTSARRTRARTRTPAARRPAARRTCAPSTLARG